MEEHWGCIAKKVEQIGEIADEMNWPELTKVVTDAFTIAEEETDPMKLFFDVYQFMFRLYYRVKDMKEPQPFNEVYEATRLIEHDNKQCYQVSDYDYKMYVWAKKKGLGDTITNNYFYIPIENLTEQERASFRKKCKNPIS